MYDIYLGGYTKNESKGIYYTNIVDNKLTNPKLVWEVENPTYLQYDYINQKLYSNGAYEKKSALTSFNIGKNNELICIDKSYSKSGNPCYLYLDAENENIHTTIYASAIFESRKYDKITGNVSNVNYSYTATGSSIVKDRQEAAHLHMVTSKDNYLYICDLGSDNILVLDRINLDILHKIKVKSGSGPRHIRFLKNYAYVITELSNELIVLYYNKDGSLTPINYISSLPENCNVHNQASAIRFGKNNSYLYVSNRGHNSITVYDIRNPKNIIPIQNIPTMGDWCRDFNLTKDYKYLIVGHEKSNNLSLFSINENGTISFISNDTYAPETTSVCII